MRRIALLESEKQGERIGAGSAASIALHVVLLSLAIAATRHTGAGRGNDPVYVPLPRWQPDVRMVSQPVPKHATSASIHVPAVSAAVPAVIPVTIPGPSVDAAAATAVGTPVAAVTGAQQGTDTASGILRGDAPYGVEEVDVAAAVLPGQHGPTYPEALRMMGVGGRVIARFIIGGDGRVEKDPVIVAATDEQFAAAVRRYLATARYRPATRNGEPVRQLAEQEFEFAVRR